MRIAEQAVDAGMAALLDDFVNNRYLQGFAPPGMSLHHVRVQPGSDGLGVLVHTFCPDPSASTSADDAKRGGGAEIAKRRRN